MEMPSYFFLVSDCRRAVLVFLGKKVLWYFRHGTFLCAYIRGNLDGGPVCFHDAATIQDAPDECSRKGVTCPHCACDLHFRRSKDGLSLAGEDAAPVRSLREDNNLQLVKTHETSAEHFFTGETVSKEMGDGEEFFLVQFQDVCSPKAFPDDRFVEIMLPEVDVANFDAVLRA